MTIRAHGSTGSYRSGCRCGPCKQAESGRKRRQRERKLTGGTVAPVTALPTIASARPKRQAMGDVEAAAPRRGRAAAAYR